MEKGPQWAPRFHKDVPPEPICAAGSSILSFPASEPLGNPLASWPRCGPSSPESGSAGIRARAATAGPAAAQLPSGNVVRNPPGVNDFSCKPPKLHRYPIVVIRGTDGDQAFTNQRIAPVLLSLATASSPHLRLPAGEVRRAGGECDPPRRLPDQHRRARRDHLRRRRAAAHAERSGPSRARQPLAEARLHGRTADNWPNTDSGTVPEPGAGSRLCSGTVKVRRGPRGRRGFRRAVAISRKRTTCRPAAPTGWPGASSRRALAERASAAGAAGPAAASRAGAAPPGGAPRDLPSPPTLGDRTDREMGRAGLEPATSSLSSWRSPD